MAWRDALPYFLRRTDRRSDAEVAREVDEELAFHVAMRARDLEASGLGAEEAAREAERRFGDRDRVARACLTAQLGDRILLRRLQTAALLVFVAATLVLALRLVALRRAVALADERAQATQEMLVHMQARQAAALAAQAAAQAEASGRDWPERLREAGRRGWPAAYALGAEIAELPPDEGLAVLRSAWAGIEDVATRQQILKAFALADPPHARLADVLDLGARDREPKVRSWAWRYLGEVALRDFGADLAGYDAWRARFEGQPLDLVRRGSARELVERLGELSGPALAAELRYLSRLRSEGGELAASFDGVTRGLALALVARWLAGPHEVETRRDALAFAAKIDPGEEFLRREVLPRISSEPEIASAACRALGETRASWAVDAMLELAATRVGQNSDGRADALLFAAGDALGAIGDPRAIPGVIALIDADETYATRYGLGYFGLSKLTGVDYDEAHDGAFWRRWWEENRARMPEGVRELDVPVLATGR